MECLSVFSVITDFFRDLSLRIPIPARFLADLWFSGPVMFTMRFIVQWIASEKKRESVIPVAFWFSVWPEDSSCLPTLSGRWTLFSSLPISQSIIYLRNLYFIYRESEKYLFPLIPLKEPGVKDWRQNEGWIVGGFLVASGLILFFNLWGRSLENHGYLRYAEVAREMIRSGTGWSCG